MYILSHGAAGLRVHSNDELQGNYSRFGWKVVVKNSIEIFTSAARHSERNEGDVI